MSTSREIKPSTQPRYQPASSPSAVPASAARLGDEGHDQRDSGAKDETREHVPAKVVRAKVKAWLCAYEPRWRE
jgi:hypothetical protein